MVLSFIDCEVKGIKLMLTACGHGNLKPASILLKGCHYCRLAEVNTRAASFNTDLKQQGFLAIIQYSPDVSLDVYQWYGLQQPFKLHLPSFKVFEEQISNQDAAENEEAIHRQHPICDCFGCPITREHGGELRVLYNLNLE